VLHPMGWDAFGLAGRTVCHPNRNSPGHHHTKKLRHLPQPNPIGWALSYDWDREINTTDPAYFKWTQWIFIRLYNTWFDAEQQKGRPINELPIPADMEAQGAEAVRAYVESKNVWLITTTPKCGGASHCKTVCANEEVLADGSHEKCGTKEVERRNLKQWIMRIPHYAERLLEGLDSVDWPEGIKDMQRNWIGKSHGAEVDFAIADAHGVATSAALRVYTTRPDTLFGATYMVVAPEHALVPSLTTAAQQDAVQAYIKAAALKSDLDRTELAKEKTGVFTGSYAVNPVNGSLIPIWVADYVLTGYGTGAIMAVPAHDTRDFEFAVKFNLPVICIMEPDASCSPELREKVMNGTACWTNDGNYIRSSNPLAGLHIDGMSKKEGIATVVAWLEDLKIGHATTNYKIRDWLFSRQRYWGEPFPVIHWEDGSISLVDESELPVTLPEMKEFKPGDGGESPLANAGDWLTVIDADTGRKGRRETNTMPQWAGSCWYYLRYIDPQNDSRFIGKEEENYWMPVDLYVGGAEHAVLHLLYSRFWHKVLFDLGHVSTPEPFHKLFNQGMILAFAYEDSVGSKVPSDEVEERDGKYYKKDSGIELKQIVAKMSKSLKNVVNPDDVVREHGADSLRLYEMFMGPLEATKPWQSQGIEGVYRFLARAWRAIASDEDVTPTFSDEAAPAELVRLAHQSILKVGDDIENMRFNTAISQLMVFNNELIRTPVRYRSVCEIFVQLLHPLAPHVAEELWSILGHSGSLTSVAWPVGDPALAAENSVEIVFQVNGKVRARAQVMKDMPADALQQLAKEEAQVAKYLENSTIVKAVVVPNKLVNFVVKPN
jgi:leucyl-tRNA synthetase